jgi:hypothetical protein
MRAVGARLRRLWAAGRPVRRALAVSLRRSLLLLMVLAGVVLVVAGIALIYPPAGVIAAGLALFGILTFNPSAARRLIWPR